MESQRGVYYLVGVTHTDLVVAAVPVQVSDINLGLFGNSRQIKQTLSHCMGTVYKLHFLCWEFMLLSEPTAVVLVDAGRRCGSKCFNTQILWFILMKK